MVDGVMVVSNLTAILCHFDEIPLSRFPSPRQLNSTQVDL